MRCLTLILLALLTASPCRAAVETGAQFTFQTAYRSEEQAWVYQRAELRLQLEAQGSVVSERAQTFQLRVELRARQNLGATASDAPPSELRAQQLILRYQQGGLRLDLGLQELSWGELLGPSLLDLTQPRDLREPGELIKSLEKVPEEMIVVGWTGEALALEAFVTPQPRDARLPSEISGLELVAASKARDPAYGLRAGRLWGAWDLKAYALQHTSRLPLLIPSPADNAPTQLLVQSRQEQSLGASASVSWHAFVLRSEALWSRVLQPQAHDPFYQRAQQQAIALDYTTESQWLVMGQLQQLTWLDCLGPLRCPDTEVWASYLLQRSFDQLRLTPRIFIFNRPRDGASYHKQELQWQSPWSLDFTLSHESFLGMKGLPWALLKKADRWVLAAQIAF